MGDLAPDDAEPHALDGLASGDDAGSDRVFHELRDIADAPGNEALDTAGGPDDPDDAPPLAATAAFDISAVNDDLLPSWNLDLG